MIPWERDIYVQMLVDYIKEENERKQRDKQWVVIIKKVPGEQIGDPLWVGCI